MHVATTHIGRLVRSAHRLGTVMLAAAIPPGRLLAAGLLVTAASLVAGLVVGDLLAPASETVLTAPFRWSTLSGR